MYNRVRTDNTSSVVDITATYSRYQNTDVVAHVNGWRQGIDRTMWDVSVPSFNRESSRGVVFNNPMRSVKKEYGYTPGTRSFVCNTPPAYVADQTWKLVRNGNNGVGSTDQRVNLDISSAIAEACTKALSSIEQPTVEGLPFLAELRSTIQAVRNPLRGIGQAIDSYKKKRGVRQVSKDLAGQHLSLIYGIMPAIRDVESTLDAISSLAKRPPRKTARGTAQRSGSVNYTRAYNDGEVQGTINGTCTRTVTVRAGSLYSINLDLGFSRFGFTISDVPSAAWELVPFSFVVDWFVDVGRVISAITPKVGITRLAEWYTVTDVSTTVETLGSVTLITSGWTGSGGGDVASYTVTEKYRVPCSLGDFVAPTLDGDLSAVKDNVFAILSLLIQKLK